MSAVIKGWDKGVITMKRGEKALLTCKSDYAYGEAGSPPKIPPNATLQFEVRPAHPCTFTVREIRQSLPPQSLVLTGCDLLMGYPATTMNILRLQRGAHCFNGPAFARKDCNAYKVGMLALYVHFMGTASRFPRSISSE